MGLLDRLHVERLDAAVRDVQVEVEGGELAAAVARPNDARESRTEQERLKRLEVVEELMESIETEQMVQGLRRGELRAGSHPEELRVPLDESPRQDLRIVQHHPQASARLQHPTTLAQEPSGDARELEVIEEMLRENELRGVVGKWQGSTK